MTAIIYMWTMGNCKNIYNTESFLYCIDTYNLHTSSSYNINIMMTYVYVMVLTNFIFQHAICTIHKNVYVFLKNYNNVHFTYQLLWVQMAHTDIISETPKNLADI